MFRPVYEILANFLDGRADTALYQLGGGILGKGRDKEILSYLYVTPSLTKVLGVHVIAGRPLSASDMSQDSAPVIVVSARLARRRFGSYSAALDRRLHLSGTTYRIVGILPPTLQFPSKHFLGGYSPQAWIPLPPSAPGLAKHLNHRMYAVVHAHPGFSVAALKTEFVRAYREALPKYTVALGTHMKQIRLVPRVASWGERQYGPILTRLRLLGFAALLFLFLVAVNLAGLTATDVVTRRQELTVRAALGANRMHLFLERLRMLFGLGFVGWMIGIALGFFGQRALAGAIGQAGSSVALSAPVLLLTFSFMSAVVIALSPIGLHRFGEPRNWHSALGAGRGTIGSRVMVRVMRSLIVLQLAVGVLLLIITATLYLNVFGLTHNNLGFALSHRTFFRVAIPKATSARKELFDRDLLARLNQQADIKSAAHLSILPFSGNDSGTSAWLSNEHDKSIPINEQAVSKHFIEAMGLKILAGDPDSIFSGSRNKIFVDETALSKLWPHAKPSDVVGQSVYLGLEDNGPYRITAVVTSVRMKPFGLSGGTFFIPYNRVNVYGSQRFVVHSSLRTDILNKTVASSVNAVNPRAVLVSLQSANSLVAHAYYGRMVLGRVFGVLTMAAVFIAALGLFALLAYRARLRRPEFAIRAALGATYNRLVAKVLAEASAMWAISCVIGVSASYGISLALSAYFPELGLPSPYVTVAASGALGIIAACAAIPPACRSASTNLPSDLSV